MLYLQINYDWIRVIVDYLHADSTLLCNYLTNSFSKSWWCVLGITSWQILLSNIIWFVSFVVMLVNVFQNKFPEVRAAAGEPGPPEELWGVPAGAWPWTYASSRYRRLALRQAAAGRHRLLSTGISSHLISHLSRSVYLHSSVPNNTHTRYSVSLYVLTELWIVPNSYTWHLNLSV